MNGTPPGWMNSGATKICLNVGGGGGGASDGGAPITKGAEVVTPEIGDLRQYKAQVICFLARFALGRFCANHLRASVCVNFKQKERHPHRRKWLSRSLVLPFPHRKRIVLFFPSSLQSCANQRICLEFATYITAKAAEMT